MQGFQQSTSELGGSSDPVVKTVFAYIRVSTVKQGQHGVSLQEQREAIARYASRQSLTIARWFEERQTAAKRGRPIFNEMLRLLARNEASGVVIHKIDRSTRNLRDWADLGDLLDRGIDVHFAVESLDLHSRGGRLSADIQAVVATDFIRNLREETRKGFYGRLKQGLYPLAAPLGYLDQGGGKDKTIDPVSGPLVRRAFELYATGTFTLDTLVAELAQLGLRNRQRKQVSLNGVSRLLNNPFYIGLIRLQSTGEVFQGSHARLVPKVLFDRVHAQLKGKVRSQGRINQFLFRRCLHCQACGRTLIGERQKGHVYYRCHTSPCPTRTVREEAVECEALRVLAPLKFSLIQNKYFAQRIARLRSESDHDKVSATAAVDFRLGKLQDRLHRLTDAFLDGTVERTLFEDRKKALLLERISLEDTLRSIHHNDSLTSDKVAEYLELAGRAYLSYTVGLPEEKRALLEELTSNRAVLGKDVVVELREPYADVAQQLLSAHCDPYRDTARTLSQVFDTLLEWVKNNQEKKCSIQTHSL
jgi:site-specific DNA recombinase